jgi:hypothetical protein
MDAIAFALRIFFLSYDYNSTIVQYHLNCMICMILTRDEFSMYHFLCSWLRNCATNRKVEDSIPDKIIEFFFFFNLPNPSSRTMSLGSTQPLTDMSTRDLPGGKKRSVCKADNLTAIREPIV